MYRFDRFKVDPETRRIWNDDELVPLSGKPFDLLLALLAREGRIASRADLVRELWPDTEYLDFDNNLNVAVRKIRDALGESAKCEGHIETVPRYGYRFSGCVEVVPRDSPIEAGSPAVDRVEGSQNSHDWTAGESASPAPDHSDQLASLFTRPHHRASTSLASLSRLGLLIIAVVWVSENPAKLGGTGLHQRFLPLESAGSSGSWAGRPIRLATDYNELLLSFQGPTSDRARLLEEAIRLLLRRGSYPNALPLAEEALRLSGASGLQPPTARSSLLLVAAQTLAWHSRYDEALEIAQKAAEELPPNDPRTDSLHVEIDGLLAELLAEFGDDAAIGHANRAIDRARQTFGDQSPETATALRSGALTLRALDRPFDAETYALQSLELRRHLNPYPSSEVAEANLLLSAIRFAQGRMVSAHDLAEESLAEWKALYGDEPSYQVITALSNLGTVQAQRGLLDESRSTLQEAYRLACGFFGATSEWTMYALSSLAFTTWKLGRLDEAEALHREALRVRTQVLGPDHPSAATSQHNLACVLFDLGRLEEAEALESLALATRQQVFGPTSLHTAYSAVLMARIYLATDRSELAEPLLLDALAARESTYGVDSAEANETKEFLLDCCPDALGDRRESTLRSSPTSPEREAS